MDQETHQSIGVTDPVTRTTPIGTRGNPLNSILVKPSGSDCNLDCTYCFYRDRAHLSSGTHTQRMSEAVLVELIRQSVQAGEPHVTFIWQGGEPTLMGLPFFEKVIEFQMK